MGDGKGTGRVLFLYWGRRGSLSWTALELGRHLASSGSKDVLSYSAENELAEELAALAPATQPFRTFSSSIGAATGIARLLRQLRALQREILVGGFDAVVVLMSHVWTPLLGRRLARLPVRYVVVVHDASPHPGDTTGRALSWTLRDLRWADRIVTHTRFVADRLIEGRGVAAEDISVLPHPAFAYGAGRRERSGPLRVLFLGRIMAYKGLDLLVAAAERLKARGVAFELSVCGEGDLGGLGERLAAIGAEVMHRWIRHDEIGSLLTHNDVIVLPYIEASQSGVAAAAQGAGLPVVATPSGGLPEQVRDNVDGLIAADVTAEALADALERLTREPGLYDRLAAGAREAAKWNVAAFAEALRTLATTPPVDRTSGR